MGGKVFRIVFASALLFLNAVIYSVVFSPNAPLHLNYIPADAQSVISLNSKQIAGQLTYNVLFHEEQFVSLLEADDESEKVDLTTSMNNGLQFLGRITLVSMFAPDGQLVSFMMADISSKSKLEQFLEKECGKIDDLDQAVRFCSNEKMAYAFNEEVALVFTGGFHPDVEKKVALHVLHQKNPSPVNWLDVAGNDDFMMNVHPGIEKMDQAPALKGLLGSFINALRLNGKFEEDGIRMKYVLATDPVLLANAADVFTIHEHPQQIPPGLLEGIFNLHLTFDPDRWVDWMAKGDLLNVPDSLESKLYGGLRSALGEKFVLEVDGVRIVRLDENPEGATRKGLNSVPVPEFKAAFSLSDSARIRELFDQLVMDSLLKKTEGGLYEYEAPFQMTYHFSIDSKVLSLSNTDRYITDIESLYQGYSNWFYFNATNFIDAIPMESPFGFMIKGVMEQITTVHYGYGYSVGTEANRVNFEGKVYYNDKKKHSLIETIRFMRALASMFISSGPIEGEDDPGFDDAISEEEL